MYCAVGLGLLCRGGCDVLCCWVGVVVLVSSYYDNFYRMKTLYFRCDHCTKFGLTAQKWFHISI